MNNIWTTIHMGLTNQELNRGEEKQRRDDEFDEWMTGWLNMYSFPMLREMSMEYWGHPGI